MTSASRTGLMGRGRSFLPFVLTLVAVLAVELAWMSAIGPFRGIDEFEHVYRADSVAHGNWISAPGGLVTVDRDLYEAGRPVCLSRKDLPDCVASATSQTEQVEVPSTATAYDPLFYAVVGSVSSPFHGYGQIYAMRLFLMVVNALFVAIAIAIALRCFATRWPAFGIVLTLVPQAAAAGMVVAPNGLENSAALLLWTCLLAAVLGDVESSWRRWLPLGAGLAGCMLAVLRTLGPFWLALVVLVAVLAARGLDGREPEDILRGPRALRPTRAWSLCLLAWAIACAVGGGWSLVAGTNSLQSVRDTFSTATTSASGSSAAAGDQPPGLVLQMIVWICQVVGALPYRDEPLPLILYALTFLVWAGVSVLALTRTSSAVRRSAGAVVVLSILIPIGFAIATGHGDLWQGRYGWPLAMGYFLLLGVALDRRDSNLSVAHARLAVWAAAAVYALVMGAAMVHVVGTEQEDNPLVGEPAWWMLPKIALVALSVLAFLLLALVTSQRHRTRDDQRAFSEQPQRPGPDRIG